MIRRLENNTFFVQSFGSMGSDTAWAARDRPGKRGLLIALSLGFALRFCLLYFSDLPTLLQVRPELSTPVNSWESLLEAHFLQRQHHRGSVASVDTSLTKDFYSVGTIHHSPLTLLFLDAPLSRFLTKNDSLAISLTWSLVDVLSGWLLSRICRMNDLSTQSAVSTFSNKSRATKVAAMFLFNPYTIAVCIARSTAPIETAAILASIYAAMKGECVAALLPRGAHLTGCCASSTQVWSCPPLLCGPYPRSCRFTLFCSCHC